LSFRDALLYPLKVSIQNLSQGCPVPPGCQSEPEKECPRRQYDNANEVPVEQDNSGENRGRGGSQKSNDGAASQEDPAEYFINASHQTHRSLHAARRRSWAGRGHRRPKEDLRIPRVRSNAGLGGMVLCSPIKQIAHKRRQEQKRQH